jgi:hypothetical protein
MDEASLVRLLQVCLAVFGMLQVARHPLRLYPPPPHVCLDNAYWDDVDRKCVKGGIEVTEINGIPIEEIAKVLDRHRLELHAIKGVTGSGIDRHGPVLEVQPDHGEIPKEIEGIPVHIVPAKIRVGG